jgi:hypothetical protein
MTVVLHRRVVFSLLLATLFVFLFFSAVVLAGWPGEPPDNPCMKLYNTKQIQAVSPLPIDCRVVGESLGLLFYFWSIPFHIKIYFVYIFTKFHFSVIIYSILHR